jgi:hypothetical protein
MATADAAATITFFSSILGNSTLLLGWVFVCSLVAAGIWSVKYKFYPSPSVLTMSEKREINFGIMVGFGTLGAMMGLLSASIAPTIGGTILPATVTVLLGYLASKPSEDDPLVSRGGAGGAMKVNAVSRMFMTPPPAPIVGAAVPVADAGTAFVWVPARVLLACLALFWSTILGYHWNDAILKAQIEVKEGLTRVNDAKIVQAAHQNALELFWLEKFVIACKTGAVGTFDGVDCDAPRPDAMPIAEGQ